MPDIRVLDHVVGQLAGLAFPEDTIEGQAAPSGALTDGTPIAFVAVNAAPLLRLTVSRFDNED